VKTNSVYLLFIFIIIAHIYGQIIDNSEEIEAIKEVIISEGIARQNNDFELFSECWAHEPYITNYWAINWGCTTIKGWDELSQWFGKYHHGEPKQELKIRRENINIHINGNMALTDFDLYVDNYPGGDLESKANATLEKLNGSWKIVCLTVIFHKSFNESDNS
jgi:hypothetical protein